MTKRADQKAGNRHHILKVARLQFEARGYEGTTLRGIAKAAGMSTGAIFGNWPDKASIYREVYGCNPVTPEQGKVLLEAAKCVLYDDGRKDAVSLLAAVVASIEGRLPRQQAMEVG